MLFSHSSLLILTFVVVFFFFVLIQSMHTCCLLCHREFKDWGAGSVNGLPAPKLADAVPALPQALLREVPGRKQADSVPSLLGEVPLWICQSCKKSVEEDERRAVQEQVTPVGVCKTMSCLWCLYLLGFCGVIKWSEVFVGVHSLIMHFIYGRLSRHSRTSYTRKQK